MGQWCNFVYHPECPCHVCNKKKAWALWWIWYCTDLPVILVISKRQICHWYTNVNTDTHVTRVCKTFSWVLSYICFDRMSQFYRKSSSLTLNLSCFWYTTLVMFLTLLCFNDNSNPSRLNSFSQRHSNLLCQTFLNCKEMRIFLFLRQK